MIVGVPSSTTSTRLVSVISPVVSLTVYSVISLSILGLPWVILSLPLTNLSVCFSTIGKSICFSTEVDFVPIFITLGFIGVIIFSVVVGLVSSPVIGVTLYVVITSFSPTWPCSSLVWPLSNLSSLW